MDPPFFWGGSLSLVLVVLAWLLQLFRFVQVTWVSWTFCLGFLSHDFQCFIGSSEWVGTYVSVLSCLLFGCVFVRPFFCEQQLLASAFEAPRSCLALALRFFLDGFMVRTRCPSISRFRLGFSFPSFRSGGSSFGDIFLSFLFCHFCFSFLPFRLDLSSLGLVVTFQSSLLCFCSDLLFLFSSGFPASTWSDVLRRSCSLFLFEVFLSAFEISFSGRPFFFLGVEVWPGPSIFSPALGSVDSSLGSGKIRSSVLGI